MCADDEILLEAYLDDELEPEQRRRVEFRVAANPRLAARLRALAAVRDLIAGLSRPVTPDMTPQIMSRLRLTARHRQARPWSQRRRSWTALAVAASVLGAVAILTAVPSRLAAPSRIAVATSPSESVAHAAGSPSSGGNLTASLRPDSALPGEVFGPAEAQAVPYGTLVNQVDPQQRVRALLDDPRLSRVFLVADRIGQPTTHQVASLVERTSHRDFFKITVAEGIVIDPRHPDHATVFAVVLDDSEFEPFRNRLKEAFRDRLEESDIDPAVAMQLAEIGQVVALPAHPLGDLTIPSVSLALRTGAPGGSADALAQSPPASASGPTKTGPTVEQERSSPAAGLLRDGSGRVENQQTLASGDEAAGAGAVSRSDPEPGAGLAASDASGARSETNHDPLRLAFQDGRSPTGRNSTTGKHHRVVLVWIAGSGSG